MNKLREQLKEINFRSFEVLELIALQLLLILGYILFDVSIYSFLIFYWIENVFIGIFNVVKLFGLKLDKNGIKVPGHKKLFFVPFFFIAFFALNFIILFGLQIFLEKDDDIQRIPFMIMTTTLFIVSIIDTVKFFKKGKAEKTNFDYEWIKPFQRILFLAVIYFLGLLILGNEQSGTRPLLVVVMLAIMRVLFELFRIRKEAQKKQ